MAETVAAIVAGRAKIADANQRLRIAGEDGGRTLTRPLLSARFNETAILPSHSIWIENVPAKPACWPVVIGPYQGQVLGFVRTFQRV
jgi:hypothetical protein